MGNVPSARRPVRSTTRWCASPRTSPSRYPLVDGQGNFGNIDGDNPAAYRYTEAAHDRGRAASARRHRRGRGRLPADLRRPVATEPMVLPGAFPNLLANGSTGHRRRHGDLDPAAQRRMRSATPRCALIDKPNARRRRRCSTTSRCRTSRPAASSSTRREIDRRRPMPPAAVSFRVRASWHRKEEGSRGTYQIVVTEIPVAVQKSAPDRADRRALQREEAAAAQGRPRRDRRRRARRHRAASRARSSPAS